MNSGDAGRGRPASRGEVRALTGVRAGRGLASSVLGAKLFLSPKEAKTQHQKKRRTRHQHACYQAAAHPAGGCPAARGRCPGFSGECMCDRVSVSTSFNCQRARRVFHAPHIQVFPRRSVSRGNRRTGFGNAFAREAAFARLLS